MLLKEQFDPQIPEYFHKHAHNIFHPHGNRKLVFRCGVNWQNQWGKTSVFTHLEEKQWEKISFHSSSKMDHRKTIANTFQRPVVFLLTMEESLSFILKNIAFKKKKKKSKLDPINLMQVNRSHWVLQPTDQNQSCLPLAQQIFLLK
ncbi:hypothetical protein VP01_3102g3 [Puccinia sorghi]|uniref:Uncharacterized protein n=1 Tax=Puccinia sorghi TaxID=27349 RepID=A0A0L6UZD4_9BASI|nr:hypothetical protein VP01_3102g3 [Puccinia sorghi]